MMPCCRYRQDNENSSVNSSAKVFCVNTEYAEIERWIREDYARDHVSVDVARMLKFNQLIKYDSYMWNYVRLAPKFYKRVPGSDGQGVPSGLGRRGLFA